MIQSICIQHFRNFEKREANFSPWLSVIYGDNWKWKSSLLEAIHHLTNKSDKWEYSVKKWKESFFIRWTSQDSQQSISYDLSKKKKIYFINNKRVSAVKFFENSLKSCSFSPETMNMFLLGPAKRREYLNQILSNSFSWYQTILKHYHKILKSRNAILGAIYEKKTQESELDYWDSVFISAATEVYRYRYILIQFLESYCKNFDTLLLKKVNQVQFHYITKVDFSNLGKSIQNYLEKNRSRDLIIQKTHIGPHLDDFNISLDHVPLESFASRGETKSIIIGLKIAEAKFIEEKTLKKPLFLIDDFKSELDDSHASLLLELLSEHQVILTNIQSLDIPGAYHIQL